MSNDLATISNYVAEARQQFEAVTVDRSITFEREAGFATQLLTAQEFTLNTAKRNPQSVINAVANIAAMGLTLNPARKLAYLVPRDGRICLDISYMGLLDLAIQSGSIRWGQAELVYQADTFTLNGFDKPPTHSRDPFKSDRGEVVGAYVVVKTCDSDYLTTTMQIGEILDIRDRSSAWKKGQTGPWKTDPGEMMKKTVIKRAAKLWPKTDRLDGAIQHLNIDGEEGLPPIDNGNGEDGYFGVPPARMKVVRAVAKEAIEKFDVGDEFGAYGAASGITDNDEMQALWKVLKNHSSLRSCLKRLAKEEREQQEKLEKEKAEP